jgi:uncharacterized protein
MTLPVVKTTEEGYLKGEASVSRVGVFKYRNADGSIRSELRHPDDVFAAESLNTLKNIPITFNHPEGYELVNSDNASRLMGGMTGDNVYVVDDRLLNVSLAITDGKMIDKIKKHGIKELSMGYTRTIVPEEGVYKGQSYTHRQKDIKYNHLAIVAEGRAGREVRLITMDGIDYECLHSENINNDKEEINLMDEKELNKITDRLDSIEKVMQVAKDSAHESELNQAKATIETLNGEIEGLKAKLNNVANDSSNDVLIQEKVKERVDIMVKAKGLVALDNANNLSNREIMEASIKAASKDIVLDGKTDDYVAGVFNGLATDSNNSINQMRHLVAKDSADDGMTLAKARQEIFNKHNNR